jgi:hypothetical protein
MIRQATLGHDGAPNGQVTDYFEVSGSRFESELANDVPMRHGLAVRASRVASLGASSKSLIDDGLDGARASATFGAATETAINLLGIARKEFRGTDGAADIVVAKDVAGTNNHESRNALR